MGRRGNSMHYNTRCSRMLPRSRERLLPWSKADVCMTSSDVPSTFQIPLELAIPSSYNTMPDDPLHLQYHPGTITVPDTDHRRAWQVPNILVIRLLPSLELFHDHWLFSCIPCSSNVSFNLYQTLEPAPFPYHRRSARQVYDMILHANRRNYEHDIDCVMSMYSQA
jgi:hypothetical protein